MQKYNFMGKDTSEKEFWRLCNITSLEEIEKEIYGKYDTNQVEKIMKQFKQNEEKTVNTPICVKCGSRMQLNSFSFGNYWHCSNIVNCVFVLPIDTEE